jgi:hypothetical protein
MAFKTSIRIENSRNKEMSFYLEPWGEEIPMPPGCTFQIIAEAIQQGEMEVQYEEDRITVRGWSSSILKVYCEG